MKKQSLFTTGYEGENIHDFILKLLTNKISVVIDIREIPLSRKKGFSKNALKTILNENEIHYIHYKQLGSPKKIRHKLHEDRDYESFFNEYRSYISGQLSVLDELKETINSGNACLLCFEKDHKTCHRSIVAEELNDKVYNNTLDIINI